MVNTTLSGRCFCGEVQFEVTGQPLPWLLPLRLLPDVVGGPGERVQPLEPRVAEGDARCPKHRHVQQDPAELRKWCKNCGGHLFTDHPHWKLIDIYAAVLPQLKFEPGVHVHYQGTVLPIHDGKRSSKTFRRKWADRV